MYFAHRTSIYPGEFRPLPWQANELGDNVKRSRSSLVRPEVDMQELPYCFRVEMRAPGFRREDFFVNTQGRLLSIVAMKKNPVKGEIEYSPTHFFDPGYIIQEVVLPADLDTDFAAANIGAAFYVCLFLKPVIRVRVADHLSNYLFLVPLLAGDRMVKMLAQYGKGVCSILPDLRIA